jgi:hypothetical protein
MSRSVKHAHWHPLCRAVSVKVACARLVRFPVCNYSDYKIGIQPTFSRKRSVHGFERLARETNLMLHPIPATDAITVLKTDHEELADRFEMLLSMRDIPQCERNWAGLRTALETHLAMEAEVFYPAFLDATENSLSHFLASLGHENILGHLEDVLHAPVALSNFHFRVRSLKRAFAHHVFDMERDGGMFYEARKSTMNQDLIGRLLLARKRNP